MFSAMQGLASWAPIGIPAFLFVISVVVFFHELGHFAMARAFGVKVETFSIGFGSKIFGWVDSKGTQWKVSWLPFGGYVKFLGDMNAASVPDREQIEGMDEEARRNTFAFKPLYQRALIVFAGPLANFILAIAIFAVVFMFVGRQIIPSVVDQVKPDSAAAHAGLLPGDVIATVNGSHIDGFSELQSIVAMSAGESLTLGVERGGKTITLHATPQLLETKDRFGDSHRIGMLGIVNRIDPKEVRMVRYGPFQAVGEATAQTWFVVDTTMTYLWRMVSGREDASQLSGPVGIAKISGQVAEISFLALINLAALISVSIGLINLFPVPILDGGHLLYYGCEAILGRPLNARAQDVGFRLGLAVMLGLMVLATWNDLSRLNLF